MSKVLVGSLLAAVIALLAPGVALAQQSVPDYPALPPVSTYPSCADRVPLAAATSQAKLTDTANWMVNNLFTGKGAIRAKPGWALIGGGNSGSFGLMDAGGLYCQRVGRWLDWQLGHLLDDGALPRYTETVDANETEAFRDPTPSGFDHPLGADNVNASLLTLARMYQVRGYGAPDWFKLEHPYYHDGTTRLQLVIRAADYLDSLYHDELPVGGLTQVTEAANTLYFQDNVSTWAGYRDYAAFLSRFAPSVIAPYNRSVATYTTRASEVQQALNAYLYAPDAAGGRYQLYRTPGSSTGPIYPYACWYSGAFTHVFGLSYPPWGVQGGLPESDAVRGKLFTQLMETSANGWVIDDVPAAGSCDRNQELNTPVAFAAVRAATADAAAGGGLKHAAAAIVWERNLPPFDQAPYPVEPNWSASSAGSYMRYLAAVGVHVVQDDTAGSPGYHYSGNWTAENVGGATVRSDGMPDIHLGPTRRYASTTASDTTTLTAVRFVPDIPERGLYTVRLVYRPVDARTENPSGAVPVGVLHLDTDGVTRKLDSYSVNQTIPMEDDATQPIDGTHAFCFDAGRNAGSLEQGGQWIRVSNGSTPRNVSADAVVLQKVGDC
ncbi:MAG TPA: hypothetical protein VF533_04665 [Solirubrobacteraceae bacterium]|jgi:hypothetical protein